jgi:hypothetical protein
LLATVKAVYEKEDRYNRFQAMLQGVDLDEKADEDANDIIDLDGWKAQKEGFGIGLGLGYEVQ